MVSEQVTRAYKIFRVMAMISGSLVFNAAIPLILNYLTFDGDDELRDDWEHLGSSLLQHVENSLHCQESIWILLLSDSFKEDGQVMMVIELSDFDFPVNPVLRSMLNCNREISSVVEPSEL